MKPILLLFTLLIFGLAGNAATITGSVSLNVPVYSHQSAWGTKVYLYDTVISSSTGLYIDSTIVNSSGTYSFTVPSSTTTGSFKVVAWAYNYPWNSAFYSYTGSSVTVSNILINGFGPVLIDSIKNAITNLPETGKTVYLLDSTASLFYLDSAVVDATGSVTFGIPAAITSGFLKIYTTACGVQSQIVNYTGTNVAAPKMFICGSSVTVSGTLSNASTSAGIPYYKVYLTDSSTTSILHRDSAFSDASGHYAFHIPVSVTTGKMIVWAQACGSRVSNSSPFSGSSLTINLAVCSSSTAVISGDVSYDWGHASPVYNEKVYLLDSTSPHHNLDSTLTDYAGHYSFAVPPALTSGTFIVYTTFCGTASQTISYVGSSISVPTIYTWCSSAPKSILYGATHLGGAANSGPTMLYLILKKYDAVLLDTTLTAIDSFTTIGSTGNFYKTYIPNVYTMTDSGRGRLLLKAALQTSHPSYGAYLPAYHDSALNWAGAVAVDSSNIVNIGHTYFYAANNINLPAGVNPGGSGFIGGSVLVGANKNTAVGDPLSSRILILTTASGKAVGFTHSDAGGHFKFPNLAYGSYLIFGDAWGKTNPPLSITLSAANSTVNNIIFEENNKSFKGHLNELSVNNNNGPSLINLYPNPVHNYVSLNGLNAIEGDKTVVIRDITGAILSKTSIRAGSSASINTGGLPAGIYLLQLQSKSGVSNFKFIKD